MDREGLPTERTSPSAVRRWIVGVAVIALVLAVFSVRFTSEIRARRAPETLWFEIEIQQISADSHFEFVERCQLAPEGAEVQNWGVKDAVDADFVSMVPTEYPDPVTSTLISWFGMEDVILEAEYVPTGDRRVVDGITWAEFRR